MYVCKAKTNICWFFLCFFFAPSPKTRSFFANSDFWHFLLLSRHSVQYLAAEHIYSICFLLCCKIFAFQYLQEEDEDGEESADYIDGLEEVFSRFSLLFWGGVSFFTFLNYIEELYCWGGAYQINWLFFTIVMLGSGFQRQVLFTVWLTMALLHGFEFQTHVK